MKQYNDRDYEDGWSSRFSHILPKDEICRRIRAMNQDKSTPWTYTRMIKEMRGDKMDRKTMERLGRVGGGPMSDRTQMILSRWLTEIETGKLRVYYADPNARRHEWGKPLPPEELTLDGRKARQTANKVIVEYNKVPVQKEVRQLKVTLGKKGGPRLQTDQKEQHDFDMPAFKDVVRVK